MASILASSSCKDEERHGVCYACCDQYGNIICDSNVTESDCKKYNDQKLKGYSWAFSEGSGCPIPEPSKPD